MPIDDIRLHAAAALRLALLPVALAQGRRVRRETPRIPGAGGPDVGLAPGAGPPLHLLVIGESTVAGVGAATHEEALTGQTARAVAERTGRAVRWRALGRSGTTAEEARTLLLEPAGGLRADLAAVALGVNDTLRLHGARRWTAELARLVHALRRRCGPVPVLLAGVPPVGRFPALPPPLNGVLGARARLLDAAARRFAASADRVVYVPVPLRPDEGVDGFFCADRFHPSPHGYRVWGDALARAAPLAP